MKMMPMLRVASPLAGLVLSSCALVKPPVAELVEEAPAVSEKKEEVSEVPAETLPLPEVPADGLRLPSGLTDLPNEAELKVPVVPKPVGGGGGGGALVVRPPAEPAVKPPVEPAADPPGGN